MRYASLCSGIGGLDLAVEAVWPDAEVAWFCESDHHAASVLERHWPRVPILPDIKTQDWSAVEPVELITAGYPCQPFSFAGRRGGVDDPRHLWPFVLDAIRHLRPRIVVLENVGGHLGLGFPIVLGDLAQAGFDAEWATVRAADVGACHRRERLFVVAHSQRQPVRVRPGSLGDQTGKAEGGAQERQRVRTDDGDGGTEVAPESHGWGPQLDGEAQSDAPIWGSRRRHVDGCHQPNASDAHGTAGGQSGAPGEAIPQPRAVKRPGRCDGVAWGPYERAIRRWESVLSRSAPAPTDERGRLAVPFVGWMMGFEEGWVDGLTRTAALRCLGNAVVPLQGAAALSILRGEVDK